MKTNLSWLLESYENRKKPHIKLGICLYAFAIFFIGTIVALFISLNSNWTWVTILSIDIPLLVVTLLLVFIIRLILSKIKKLAETERNGPEINEGVISEYLSLLKSTTFQMRVPKKKLEAFKEFVTSH